MAGVNRPIGTLVWSRAERRSYFEFSPAFVKNPFPLSPIKLPVGVGLLSAPYTPFDGLHGLFNDSLPDGWGRKLLDRRLDSLGNDHTGLGPLDRLAYVGVSGMGALTFIPSHTFKEGNDQAPELDWLAREAEQLDADGESTDIGKLQSVQGGSGGARPKVMLAIDKSGTHFVADNGAPLAPGYEHWIVKFRSTEDPREMGTEEFAYAQMAKAAGINVPEVRLLKTMSGVYFASKRFDRISGCRLHVHTAAGLLNASHREPSISYTTLLRLTWVLGSRDKVNKLGFTS